MASFFGVNPFLSPVGQKIEAATDASLPSENWSLNMEICDIINESEDGPKDAIKAIRKRLTHNAKNYVIVMYTLTVLETCVKNCGRKFHVLVCSKDFIQELVKIIGPKNEPPSVVQEKVLSLVQCWADAFRSIPELSGVVQVYQELKAKGIGFPMTDLDSMAPIHTPQRSQPEEVATPAVSCTLDLSPSPPAAGLSTDQMTKLSGELQVVEGNMTVLSEMLSELTPGKEHPNDLQLLQELQATCQAMQQRLVELISQLSNDEITAELLRINDGLNNIFLRYSRYEKKRTSKDSSQTETTGELIDLNERDGAAAASAALSSQMTGLSLSSQLSSIPSVTAVNTRDDEFDMFAHSRNATYESSKIGGSSYEANHETIASGGLGAAAQARALSSSGSTALPVPDLIGVHSERDFNEMEQWLGEKPEESVSSSEFERFLAERAAAGEALPPITESSASSTQRSTPRRTNKPDDEAAMFAL